MSVAGESAPKRTTAVFGAQAQQKLHKIYNYNFHAHGHKHSEREPFQQ